MPEKDKKRPKQVVEEVVETPAEEKTPKKSEEIEVLEKKHHEEKAKKVISELEDIQKTKKKKTHINFKLLIVVGLLSAATAAFVSGGFYVYFTGLDELKNEPKVEESKATTEPTSTPEPTSVPEEAIDLTKYKINVLNGRGIKGAAGAGADILTEAGFTNVDTGNAGRYDFTDTIIEAKVDVPKNVLEAASEALSDAYSVDFGDNLESSDDYDIVVTVGSD